MSDPLKKVSAIYLSPDLDDETRKDNEAKIAEWQAGLRRSEAYQSWKESDITKEIIAEVRRVYKTASITLALSRNHTDAQRHRLWAEQDAAKFLLTLVNEDANGALSAIHSEIEAAINATN